jgi:uncharacterized protein affecting Mg2+/Co2+ transport
MAAAASARRALSLAHVPDDALLALAEFLTATEACSLTRCSKELARGCERAGVWRLLCERDWLCGDGTGRPVLFRAAPDSNWRDLYREKASLFGVGSVETFQRVARAWQRVERLLQTAGQAAGRLRPGATAARIAACEQVLQRRLPVDYRISLLLHDGEEMLSFEREPRALFGHVGFYDVELWFPYLPVALVERSSRQSRARGVAILFSQDLFSGAFFGLSDEGQVVRCGTDANVFTVDDCFASFVEKHGERLEQGVYEPGHLFTPSRFPLRDPLGSDTVTEGVRIRVNALFVPEQSTAAQRRYLFAYRVRISYERDDHHRFDLETRHWLIEDATGHTDEVRGPGVIGMYPCVHRGSGVFVYESCSIMRTPTGRMWGSFQFRVDGGDRVLDALIEPFHFDVHRSHC